MITCIGTLEDVKIFVKQLVKEGLNYHPDDDFSQYINIQTDKPTYSPEQASLRNKLNIQCFNVCEVLGIDIYDVAQEVFLMKTGLDKYIPLPSQVS
ncbi:hypothetical protein LLH06_07995 [Mucilaginibacter daejeonensis]|uniref:hypothetical protein n=1 Tax=Mucilaginibacter daejeonensis TaxID=398049 RepID=UPI001D17C77C|nr:hypothetical protein [Mucilaginibacter daejeonensis]UEG54905.1 hypothetical protein LLH06_07995 [Mucilaginibacter daejeonensis]